MDSERTRAAFLAVSGIGRECPAEDLVKKLDDLNTVLFKEPKTDEWPQITEEVVKKAHKHTDKLESLVLVTVGLLGLVICNLIKRKGGKKYVPTLEKVLPSVFLKTKITPQMLRNVALQSPFLALEKEWEKREDCGNIFVVWRESYGWDFIPSKTERRPLCVEEPTQKSIENTGKPLKKTSLRDRAPHGKKCEIPAYMLVKRRPLQEMGCARGAAASPLVHAKVELEKENRPEVRAPPHDVTKKETILAFKSPVKRRRMDETYITVPPPPKPPTLE